MQQDIKTLVTNIISTISDVQGYRKLNFIDHIEEMVSKVFRVSKFRISNTLEGKDDLTIIKSIKYASKKYSYSNRGVRRAKITMQLLGKVRIDEFKIGAEDNALDFGCGDGYSGYNIFKMLGINKNRSFGVDLYDQKSNPLIYTKISDVKDIDTSKKYKIILCNMSLHHVRDLDAFIITLRSVLAEGGHFIIREHDALNEYYKKMIDLEHVMYIVKNNEKLEFPITNVVPIDEWNKRFDIIHKIPEEYGIKMGYNRPYLLIAR
jgi:2-polyprenyl-3-methyl-5-hydroxy-6-metoxy-1,4-benzoquinol methylase